MSATPTVNEPEELMLLTPEEKLLVAIIASDPKELVSWINHRVWQERHAVDAAREVLEQIEAVSMLTSDPLAYLDEIHRKAQAVLAAMRGTP